MTAAASMPEPQTVWTCGVQIPASTAKNLGEDPATVCARSLHHVEPVHGDESRKVLWTDPQTIRDNEAAARLRVATAEHIAQGRLSAPEYAEADVTAVLARLRQLEGEQLNPATETLDADAYRHLRDEIAATMTDDWDGDEAESWILAQYVRWLAAGQPRDEDGYPVRRETYPATEVKAERNADVRAVAEACADFDNDEGPRGIRQLYARFADRIAELDQRDTANGGRA